jgi:hypothetical protein
MKESEEQEMKSRYEETLKDVTTLFMSWVMGASNPDFQTNIEGVHDESFICKVLNKRLEAFGLPIIIPDTMSVILECCTGANPGLSLMLAHKVISKAHTEGATMENKYTITPEDFSNVFCFEFPIIVDNPKLDKEYEKEWDDQKYEDERGRLRNKIDTPEYWKEAVGIV